MGLSFGADTVDALYVGGSAVTRAYLDGEVIYPDSGGIAAWPTPVHIAHRGGMNIYPENTQEAFDYAVAAGYPIELDVVQLSDGDFAVIHDTTMDRTTTSTGNVSSINRATFLAATCDASSWWGTASSATLVTLDQVLDRYGKSATYVIELKGGSRADLTTLLDGYSWAVDYVVLASFDRTTCNDMATDGYEVMFLVPDGSTASANTGASLLASGINYVGVAWEDGVGISTSTLTTYDSAGMNVFAYTVNSLEEAGYVTTTGACVGVVTDDPIYTSDDTDNYIRTSDPWSLGYYWPGHVPFYGTDLYSPSADSIGIKARGEVSSGVLAFDHQATGSVAWQGWAKANGATTWTVDLDIRYPSIGNTSRWGGVHFCMVSDNGAPEGTGLAEMDGYAIVCRPNGTWQLYKGTNGSYSSLGSRTMASMSAGDTASLRIEVTPTAITVTRTDVSAPNTITSSDTSYRGEHLCLRRNSFTGQTIDVEFENMTISRS